MGFNRNWPYEGRTWRLSESLHLRLVPAVSNAIINRPF